MPGINKNELVKSLKESLDIRPEKSSDYIDYMLKLTVMDISRLFSSLFYEETTLSSDSNGVIELPDDTFKIISVQHNTREAQPLDMREYQVYSNRDWTVENHLYATAYQSVDKVELKLIPQQTYTNVTIIYQTLNKGVGNIPIWNQDVLFWGTRYHYLMSKRPEQDKIAGMAQKQYEAKKNQLRLEQNKMYPNQRFKNYWESAWERNFLYELSDETRDV